jgi:hypothetical protein
MSVEEASEPRQAISRLDEDERSTVTINDGQGGGFRLPWINL